MKRWPFLVAMAVAWTPAVVAEDDGFQREGKPAQRVKKDALEGKAPPSLDVDWLEGRGLDWKALQGKVVVLDFWGTWCGPCRRATPHLKALHEKFHKKGLVIIGVHTTRGGEKAAAYVKEHKIPYPVAIDRDTKTTRAYAVDGYPDYYLIDRSGKLRVADLANADLDRAVTKLLKEKAPKTTPTSAKP